MFDPGLLSTAHAAPCYPSPAQIQEAKGYARQCFMRCNVAAQALTSPTGYHKDSRLAHQTAVTALRLAYARLGDMGLTISDLVAMHEGWVN